MRVPVRGCAETPGRAPIITIEFFKKSTSSCGDIVGARDGRELVGAGGAAGLVSKLVGFADALPDDTTLAR
jgi:hypothetical protein